MNAYCPHCGYDSRLDTPVMINDFSMTGPGSALFYKECQVQLTGSEAALMFSLMKAYPDSVTIDALLERLGSTGSYNTVDVFCTRIRKKLRVCGAPVPFESANAFGRRYMRWKA